MIGILGFAQTGKDTVSDILAANGFQRIAFADPLKRMVMQLYDFSYEQMWGSIEQKEAPDRRYPREHTWGREIHMPTATKGFKCLCCGAFSADVGAQCYLNGRYALKIIGTEGARHCYDNTWVDRTIKDAKLVEGGYRYDKVLGAFESVHHASTVIFTDCRFKNEIAGIQAAGGKVFRIKRPAFDKPAFDHPSETEQLQIPDSKLQGVIENDGTLSDLKAKVYALLETL